MIQKTVVVTDFKKKGSGHPCMGIYMAQYGSSLSRSMGENWNWRAKSQILMESLEYSATLTSDSHCGWRKVTTPSHHVATFPASHHARSHLPGLCKENHKRFTAAALNEDLGKWSERTTATASGLRQLACTEIEFRLLDEHPDISQNTFIYTWSLKKKK